ncbi:Uncharacterised protein [Mycobacteroides abscessus subsp. abscessus]|nr:Uncharacterised protein [Mycobacteroides abscessus subsp. abscessus]
MVEQPLGLQQPVGRVVGVDRQGEAPGEDIALLEVVVHHRPDGVDDLIEDFGSRIHMERNIRNAFRHV